MGFFKNLFDKIKNRKNSLDKYDAGLKKSRVEISKKIKTLSKKFNRIDSDFYDQLEEILIESDCGVKYTTKILERIQNKLKNVKDLSSINVYEILCNEILEDYKETEMKIKDVYKDVLNIIMMVGVNGAGKTTTIAKLASKLVKENKKVLLIAGDTFRAGAVEQLEMWSTKIPCSIYKGNDKQDPASVVYDGLIFAKENNFDVAIIDTAGRLQNKQNLMDELEKIGKVISKIVDYDYNTYLVLDGTTGQNGVIQAKSFSDILKVSGVIITKMDGTSKCGSILDINSELKIPVKYICFGETLEDIDDFDIENYLYSIFNEELDNE